MEILGFDTQPRTRIVFGANTVDRLGELTKELGGQRVLIVTDGPLVRAGHVARAEAALKAAGVAVAVYDAVRENPTTQDAEHCAAFGKDAGIDLFIGLGGGSSLDTAKGGNFLLTNGGTMADYHGYGKAKLPLLPLIAVPTTAGTGSECQSYALIANDATHLKMACGDPKAAPKIAVLDPTLTLTQPPFVTACTGLDALVHAVESAVSRRRTAYSQLFSREAFRLTVGAFETVLTEPDNLEARAQMLLGAAYAGLAIENSMLGAAHSAANPLTAHFNVIHGQAVGTMIPHVVRFNAQEPATAATYHELAVLTGMVAPNVSAVTASDALAERLSALLAATGLPASLAAGGLTTEAIPLLATEAAAQWTANFNPRTITAPDFEALYSAAL